MNKFAPVTLECFASGPRMYPDHPELNESAIHDCAHCGVVGLSVGIAFTRDGQRYERQLCANCWHALVPLFTSKESDVPLLLASPTE